MKVKSLMNSKIKNKARFLTGPKVKQNRQMTYFLTAPPTKSLKPEGLNCSSKLISKYFKRLKSLLQLLEDQILH